MKAHVRKKLIEFGIKPGDTVGAAVSGGADSMVLLDLLCNLRDDLNIIVEAYHFEHGIRDGESVEDMRFVERECARRGVVCLTGGDDVTRLAKEWDMSLETAARRARYAFLDKQRASVIATAHHAGDMAETVLMNLCRGSGLKGLCGIPERRGRYLRPLLIFTREEIESYAAENGIVYRHDATNDDTAYTRNYVRKEILPRLKYVNEQAVSHIAAAAKLLAEDEEALMKAAMDAGGIEESGGCVFVDIAALMSRPAAVRKRMLRLALLRFGGRLTDISAVHIDDILALAEKNESGKRIELPGETEVSVEYGRLRLGRKKEKRYNNALIDFIGEGRYALENVVIVCEKGEALRRPGTECFDIGALHGAGFRFRREGDFIRPLGMSGKKRLSDYLSDRKVPLQERDGLVLLAKGAEVLWAVGVGISDTAKVKNGGPCYIMRCEGTDNA